MSDRELLRQFRESGCESAFQGMVDRYAGLVFAVALRRTGNRSVAEEVAQSVFVILAAKAGRLKSRGELASWLHRTTLLEASNAARKESVRRRKMEELVEIMEIDTDPEWPRISPVLDEAIDQLKKGDRSAVLLRFYDGLSFREVAETLGKTEAAARKQVSRALCKLSGILQRRGITTSAAVLSTGMAAHLSAGSLPAAASAALSHGALAGVAGMSKTSLILNSINTMAYAKTKTAVAVALLAAIPIGLQWNENRKLRSELASDGSASGKTVTGKSERRPGGASAAGRQRGGAKGAGTEARRAGTMGTSGAADWRRALYEQDPVRRAQRIAALIENLDASAAPAIADMFFSEEAGDGFQSEATLFLRAWGKLDGAQAISYLVEKEGGTPANVGMLAILGGWASQNPEAARAWAEGVEDDKGREDLLFGVIDGWALVDFKAAADYAETRPRSDARTRFIELLFQRSLAAGGIAGTQNWFAGISNDDHNEIYKRRAFERIVSTMLHRDPSAAAHWIASQADGRFVSAESVQSTAAKLAETSPQDALRWLSSMSNLDEKVSERTHGRVVSGWAGKEPEAAGHWLTQNMNHPGFDEMAKYYSAAVVGVDARGAMEWAQAIQDETTRDAAVRNLARKQLRSPWGGAEELLLAGVTREQLKLAQQTRFWSHTGMNRMALDGVNAAVWQTDGGNSLDIHVANQLLLAESENLRRAEYELDYRMQGEAAAQLGAETSDSAHRSLRYVKAIATMDDILLGLDTAQDAEVLSVTLEPTKGRIISPFAEIKQPDGDPE